MLRGFPGGSDGKESACNSGDIGSVMGPEEPLEKGMVTHSSILAWRIPWIEEPGGLQSMGSQIVRHNWRDWARMQSQKDAEELRCTFLKQRVNAAHLYADGHDPIEREKLLMWERIKN